MGTIYFLFNISVINFRETVRCETCRFLCLYTKKTRRATISFCIYRFPPLEVVLLYFVLCLLSGARVEGEGILKNLIHFIPRLALPQRFNLCKGFLPLRVGNVTKGVPRISSAICALTNQRYFVSEKMVRV